MSSGHFTPRVKCCSRVLLLNAEVVYMYIYMNVQWPLKWSVIKSNKEIMMMALIIRRGNYLKHMQLISWDSWGSEWSSCFQILWLTDLAISTIAFAACMSTYLSCLGFYLVVLVKRYRCWHTWRSFSWGLLFPRT